MKYALPFVVLAAPAFADAPVVENVLYSDGRFSVTLSHGDTGWDDFADAWRVELADGTVLGTRDLAHPHVDEQPFTRSSRVAVPQGVTQVFIRASDSVGGWSSQATPVAIP